jgi:hypothetical protein
MRLMFALALFASVWTVTALASPISAAANFAVESAV